MYRYWPRVWIVDLSAGEIPSLAVAEVFDLMAFATTLEPRLVGFF